MLVYNTAMAFNTIEMEKQTKLKIFIFILFSKNYSGKVM